jgi:2-polyprenyl-3-methyl-5-hydroxy-6-metoxy-1,4-benzoquinol methylase
MTEFSREEVKCAYCNCNNFQQLFYTPESIVKCNNCGLVYTNPRFTYESLLKIYDKTYFITEDEEKIDCPFYLNYIEDKQTILKTMDLRLRKIRNFINSPGKILDVGCATGFSLMAATNLGWASYGIEISKFCYDYAKKNNLNIHNGNLQNFPNNMQFDVITMWDYLEHSLNPIDDLQICYNLLKDGGYIFLSIPNIDSWSYKLYKRNWIGFKNLEHFYFFDRGKIKNIASRAGLIYVKSYYLGKYITFPFLFSRVKYYCNWAFLKPILRYLSKNKIFNNAHLYINPYDILTIVLKK